MELSSIGFEVLHEGRREPSHPLNDILFSSVCESKLTVKNILDSNREFCRLCLSSDNLNVKIFQEAPKQTSVEMKVFSALDIMLTDITGLSRVICENCLKRVDKILQLNSWLDDIKTQYKNIQSIVQHFDGSLEEKIEGQKQQKDDGHTTEAYKQRSTVHSEDREHLSPEPCLSYSESSTPGNSQQMKQNVCTISSDGVDNVRDVQESDEIIMDLSATPSVCEERDDFVPNHKLQSVSTSRDDISLVNGLNAHSPVSLGQERDLKNKLNLTCNSHPDRYFCVCGKYYTRLSTLNKHMATHSSRLFKCPECASQFKCKEYLLKHLMSHENVKSKYQCDMCNRRFISSHLLDKHIRAHMGMKPYRCDKCDRYFSQKNLLDSHLNWHDGIKGYLCDICGMTFFSLSNMKVHKKDIHNSFQAKKFECVICQKKFSRKYHLDCHSLVHQDTRPHQCKTCQVAFKRHSQLIEHMRIHTGEKLFKCDKCDKCFRTKRVLTVHKVVHTELKVHNCNKCDKSFARRNGLLKHMKSHVKVHEKMPICDSSGK